MTHTERKNILDNAVRAYIEQSANEGAIEPGAYVAGWTLGIATVRMEDGDESDGLIIECNPGMNNFMARGVADATAEAFQGYTWAGDTE